MGFKNKLEHIVKHNVFVQYCYRFFGGLFFKFVGLFIRTQDDLVLMNGLGFKYNDSPKAIFLKMKELGLLKKYKVVWALKDSKDLNIENCTIVKMDSFKYFCTALRAKYWIACVNIERGLHFKKKKTIYLNTWHGASLNYVGNAVSGRKDFNFKHIDFFCYNGEYERDFIIRDFKVKPNALIPTGYPRNDSLYECTPEQIQGLRKKLNVPENKRVILYAPTWRETENGGNSYDLLPPIDWELWKKTLGNQYVLFLRTHPYTTKLLNVEFDDFVQNFTDYPDVSDLLMVADVLISDYSCIQLDQSILCKPQFCYGYDYDEYKKKRGFYFDLEKIMPNGVIRDQQELLYRLINLNFQKECEKTKAFRDSHMEYGGNASSACVEYVFKNRNL